MKTNTEDGAKRAGRRPAPVQRRDVRLTDRGETIVRKVGSPTELPVGTVVIEHGAPILRAKRFADGWRYLDGNGEADMLSTPFGTLDLDYPLTVVKPKPVGLYLDRKGRRQVEREGRKAQAMMVRNRTRRVEVARLAAFLRTKGIGADDGPEHGIGESGPITNSGSPTGYLVGPNGVES